MDFQNNNSFSFHLHYASPATGNSSIPAENYNINEIDFAYLDSFPPGYRFRPTEAELVIYYLKRKVEGQKLPKSKIMDVNLYHHNPDELAEHFKACGEKEWYFFTPRNKKYRNGKRPNRTTGEGYWKATGCDKKVKYIGEVVGFKRALVFYIGKPQKGVKTNWIMHEFTVVDAPIPQSNDQNDMKLDEWVLCKIHHKNDKSDIIPPLNIRQTQDEAPEAATDEETMIDASIHKKFNHIGVELNQPFKNMHGYQGDIHNVGYQGDIHNVGYQQQQPPQEQLSSVNLNPNHINIVTECNSPNLHFSQEAFPCNMQNSDLFADITVEYATLDLHSNGMDKNTILSESWCVVDYPKNEIHTDFKS
ncbi:NAC domain containing protein 2 [Euphorbia peplus]|nr:NAC domain containing protein 2 [Euphorbia peplus]